MANTPSEFRTAVEQVATNLPAPALSHYVERLTAHRARVVLRLLDGTTIKGTLFRGSGTALLVGTARGDQIVLCSALATIREAK